MKRIITTLALAMAISSTIPSLVIAEPYIAPFTPVEHLTVQQRIVKYATVYATPAQPLLDVAKCESGYRQEAIGLAGEQGIFQYKKQTWQGFETLIAQDMDINSVDDQAKMTAFIFANYPGYRSHWSCSKIMGIIK